MAYTDRQLARMTDAAYKRVRNNVPSYPDGYSLDKRREKALLATQAARFRNPLYIVEPLEHGNGGWYGSKVLAVVSARDVLKVNPVADYLNGYYDPTFGSMIRACKTPNPSDEVYLWDHECKHWLGRHGSALRGNEAKREKAARDAREAKRVRVLKRIAAKLTRAERKVLRLT